MWNQAKALRKFVQSFRKREWDAHDYPLLVIDRGHVESPGRLKAFRWTVQIVNWLHMRGDADTREGAIEELRQQLARYCAEKGSLPRPGTGRKMDLTFAATDRVAANYDLVADIVRRVIGMEPEDCFVSDESTLWDFHHGQDNAEYHRKIAVLYGVDVSDVEPPTFAAIAERIRQQRANKPLQPTSDGDGGS
jgi:hypothetical protein